MTLVLPELCRLKHWAVMGMTTDYVKWLDLNSQAAVLAQLLELGVDTGTLFVLGATYKQLRRGFTVAGALGSWC